MKIIIIVLYSMFYLCYLIDGAINHDVWWYENTRYESVEIFRFFFVGILVLNEKMITFCQHIHQ